jgi:threonine dehydrogenase-like Zn-dependent dehydrogenase
MKTWVLVGNEKLRLTEVPVPQPQANEMLIKVKAASICNRTDLVAFMYNEKPTEYFGQKLPQPDDFGHEWVVRSPLYLDHFGHEVTGVVKKVGKNITKFSVGDRVFLRSPVRTKQYSGFSEYVLANDFKAAKLPEHLSFEEGVLGELLPIAIGAARNIKVGDYVGILGQGPGGLMITQVARLQGAAKILVADKHEKRLKVAKDLGADFTVNVTRENIEKKVQEIIGAHDLNENGLDVVVDAVGTPDVLRECIRLVKKGGFVSIFGTHHLEPAIVDFVKWEEKAVTVHMANEANNLEVEQRLEKARRLLEARLIKTKPFITHVFGLEELPKAFSLLRESPEEAIKVVITP